MGIFCKTAQEHELKHVVFDKHTNASVYHEPANRDAADKHASRSRQYTLRAARDRALISTPHSYIVLTICSI